MTSRPAAAVARHEAGFTLVEILIALVVIAIGVITLSGIQTRSSRDVYASGRETRALALAQRHIEMLRGDGYAAAVSDSGSEGVYNWVARVDSSGIDLKGVDVIVTWREQWQTRTVRLETLISAR